MSRSRHSSQTKVLNLKTPTRSVNPEAIQAPTQSNYNPAVRGLLGLFIQPTSLFSHVVVAGLVVSVVLSSILASPMKHVLSAQADVQIDPLAVPLTVATVASVSNLQVPVAPQTKPQAELATAEAGFLKAPSAPTTDLKASAAPFSYTVKAGDTPAQVAAAHNVSVETVLWANNLSKSSTLKAGQQLTLIPVSGVIAQAKGTETVEQLALRYHSSLEQVLSANALDVDKPVPAGTQVVIPGGSKDLTAASATTPTTQITRLAPSVSSGNSFPWGYCTWWVASKRNIPWIGNAWQWYGNAQGMGFATGKTPRAGAVYVSWESYIGHVGYVESVGDDGSYTISEMNYAGFGVVNHRTITPGSVPLIGFIY